MSTLDWIVCALAVVLALGGLFSLGAWCIGKALSEAMNAGMGD